MTSITWKPNANGYWNVAANWTGGVVPGAADAVTLTSKAAHTIYFNTTDTVASLISTDDLLTLQGGTLAVSGSLALAGGLNETGGTLSLLGAADSVAGATISDGDVLLGASTVLTLTGATTFGNSNNYYGARIHGGGTLATTGVTTIADYGNGTAEAVLGAGLSWVNTGTVNDAGGVEAFYTPGTAFTLINQAGAVYDFTSDDGSITNGTVDNNQGGAETAGSVFNNAGLLEKTGGAGGTSNIYSVLNNTGTINVANGTLALDGGGTIGGTIIGAGSLALETGNFVLTTSFAPQNGLLIQGVTVAIPDNVTITGGFSFNGGEINVAGGTLNVSSASLSSGLIDGLGTLSTSGTTAIPYTNGLIIGGGASWINSGVINIVSQNNLYLGYSDGGATLTNLAGASVNLMGGAISNGYSNLGIFINYGTLTNTNSNAQVQVVTQDTGVISVSSGGTIDFTDGGTFSGTILGAGTVDFGGGVGTLVAGTALGISNLEIGGSTLLLGGAFTYAGALSMSGGELELNGTNFNVNSATLSSGLIDGPGTLSTSGTTTLPYTNGLIIGGGASWINSGVINIISQDNLYLGYSDGGAALTNLAGASVNLAGGVIADGYSTLGSFINFGTLTNTGSIAATVQVVTQDTGIINVGSGGTIDFTDGGTFSGTILGTGTVDFGGGVDTLVAGTALGISNLEVGGGTLLLGGAFTYAGALSMSGGELELNGTNFNVNSATLSSGLIDGPGTLSTSGTTTLPYTNGLIIGGGAGWINSGVINIVSQDNLYLGYSDGGATLTNLAGASVNLAGGVIADGYSTLGSFINFGTLTNTGSIAATVQVVTQDTSVINVAGGSIIFTDGGTFAGAIIGKGTVSFQDVQTVNFGALSIASTTTLSIGDNINLTGNATFADAFNDTISIVLNNDTLSLSGADTFGNIYYVEAAFDGIGTVATSGASTVNGNQAYSNTQLLLSGGADWSNTGIVTDAGVIQLGSYDGGGSIFNGTIGTFDLSTDTAAITNGFSYDIYGDQIPVIGTITNAGVFAKTGGSLTNTISATFINTGTVATNTGTFAFEDGGTLGGKFAAASHVSLASGDFVVSGLTLGGTLTDAATIDQTGVLTLGSGSVAGVLNVTGIYNIDNDSSVVLGSTAATTITIASTGELGKLGGTSTSTIAAAVTDNGLIFVDSGKLLLAGAISGTGGATIANGASLEIAGSAGSSLTVTMGTSSKLFIDQTANFKAKIANFVVGDTLDLGGLTITSAVGASGSVTLKNGTSTVGTLTLSGNHTGDVYALGTDGGGGTLLGIVSNSSSWTGSTADWTVSSDWSAGVPMADTNATIAGTVAKAITIGAGESDTAQSLSLSDAKATLVINGTLGIGTSFAQTGGTVELAGTINGGTIDVTGGDFAVSAVTATFNSVSFEGNLDLTQSDAQLQIVGGVITGANGAGNSTVNITGNSAGLFAETIETLNNAVIILGNSNGVAYLEDYDPSDTGALFTLGTAVSVTQSGLYATIGDNIDNDTDGMFNSGAITGAVAGGTLSIVGNLFENDGLINVSNGDTLDITVATFTNAGSLSVSGSTLILGSTNFTNTGSYSVTNSTIDVTGSLATGQILSLFTSGDTLEIAGTLNNTGATLATGSGTTLGAVTLAAGADIVGGTITDAGGGIVFTGDSVVELTGPTLTGVTYDGVINITPSDETVFLGTGNSFYAANGTSPGTINLTGPNDRLEFAATTTLNNVTILFGTSNGGFTYNGYVWGDSVDLDDPGGEGLTLALGPNALVEDNVANSNAEFANAYAVTAGFISNQGTIAAVAGGATIHVSETLINSGEVLAANGGIINFAGAFGTTPIIQNLSGGTLAGGTWSVGASSTIQLQANTKITTDAADIVLSGTGSVIQGLSGSTQITLEKSLTSIASTGTLALLAGRNYTGTLAVTDAGQLNLGGTTFAAGSLTIASGGTVSGTGFVNNTVADNGVIASAAGGTLKIAGVTGAGTLLAVSGGVLEIAGAAATTDAAIFAGVGGTLAIDTAASFAATFGNLGAGDTLDFTSLASATATISGTTLTVQAGANTYKEVINSLAAGTVLATKSDGHSGTDITFYQQAAPSLHSPEPVAFGQVHVGASLSQALTIANLAPANGYSESLDGSIGGASSLVTAAGSFSMLAAGSTSTALTVSLAAGTAGVESGTAIITLASDGTGVDGLGTTSLGTQTVNLSATVFAYATASTIAPVNLGQQHVGGTLSQFLTLSNTAAPGAYSENLDASFSGTSLGLTATGSLSELAAGASSASGLALTLSTVAAGVASGTATLALLSDGAGIDTLTSTTLAPETVAVTGTLFNLATASAPATLSFGQRHAGASYTQTIVISDTAAKGAYSENLDASFSGTSSGFATSGTISELAAGSSNSTAMIVTLKSGTGGLVSGSTTINLTSDGAGIDSLGTTALAGDTLAVTGTLFNYATASLTSKTLSFGIVHVGGTVGQFLTLTNSAVKGSFSENLDASFSGTSSAFKTSGSVTKLAAGSINKALEVLLNTGTAGALSATGTLKLTSDGGGIDSLGTTALTSQNLTITGTVNNYATASLETISGAGTLSGSGTTLALNLGAVATGGTLSDTIGVLNSASGPADLLSGNFVTGTSAPFTDTGFNSFSGITAGSADSTLGISLSDLTSGTYSETIVLDATGSNASGYSGTLAPETLVVTGTVTSGAMIRSTPTKDTSSSDTGLTRRTMEFSAPRPAEFESAVQKAGLTGAEAFRKFAELKALISAPMSAGSYNSESGVALQRPMVQTLSIATVPSLAMLQEHHSVGRANALLSPIADRTHMHI